MSRPAPPLPAGLHLAAMPLAWAYGLGVRLRNARFDAGSGVRSLPLPVLSVGNVTAGGTGKTPFVAWLASALRARGHRPLIAMRGYGAEPGEAGDEELEYRDLLPGTTVVAHPRRHQAVAAHLLRVAAAADAPDCVLLDDGFQHRQIRRDLDLVLVDAQRPGLDDRLLPSGWLREPAGGLGRASGVIVTRTDASNAAALDAAVRREHGRPPIAWTRHAWRRLMRYDAQGEQMLPLSWLRGRRVLLFAGVGNPASVRASAETEGATIADAPRVPDHVRVTAETLRRLRDQASGKDAILLTRKDWVKFRRLFGDAPPPADLPPWIVPDLAIEFVEGPDGSSGEDRVLAAARAALAAP